MVDYQYHELRVPSDWCCGIICHRRHLFQRGKMMFGPLVLVLSLGIAGFSLWVLRNADRQRALEEWDRLSVTKGHK